MPLSRGKIKEIASQECKTVEVRYDNYHENLLRAISEIIDAERHSRTERIRGIQQTVNDECNKLGLLLAEKQ